MVPSNIKTGEASKYAGWIMNCPFMGPTASGGGDDATATAGPATTSTTPAAATSTSSNSTVSEG